MLTFCCCHVVRVFSSCDICSTECVADADETLGEMFIEEKVPETDDIRVWTWHEWPTPCYNDIHAVCIKLHMQVLRRSEEYIVLVYITIVDRRPPFAVLVSSAPSHQYSSAQRWRTKAFSRCSTVCCPTCPTRPRSPTTPTTSQGKTANRSLVYRLVCIEHSPFWIHDVRWILS